MLIELPNVGKAIAPMLNSIDIKHPDELIGKDPLTMYLQLCKQTDEKIDPCVLDVFMSAVHFMETGEAMSWWKFTPRRKQLLSSK